jgi:hypothetical protein
MATVWRLSLNPSKVEAVTLVALSKHDTRHGPWPNFLFYNLTIPTRYITAGKVCELRPGNRHQCPVIMTKRQ